MGSLLVARYALLFINMKPTSASRDRFINRLADVRTDGRTYIANYIV